MTRLGNSIAWRLTIWFLLLSLLPIGVLAIFVRRNVNQAFVDMAANGVSDQARLLAAEVSLSSDESAVKTLLEASSDESHVAFLVDKDGLYVAHSDEEKTTGSVYDDFPSEIVEQILTGGEGVAVEEESRLTVGYSAAPAQDTIVAIAMDGSVVSAPIARIEGSALLQLGVSLALISIIGGVAMWILVGPLQQLTRAAEEIGAGHLDVEIDLSQMEGELETLAVAFKQMAEQLRELVGGLEQRVAERTADLERRAVQLQAAAEVARDATAVLDVEELMRTTVRRISDRFGFYHAGIFLLDEVGEYAVLRAASSEGGERMLARGHRLKVGEVGIVGDVAGSGKPRIALDVGADAVFFDNPDLPETRSEMALPLRARGEIIGVLDVQSTEAAAFSDEDVRVLQTVADQVAMAISNARLYRQVQESLEAERRAYGELSREAWTRMVRVRPNMGYLCDAHTVSPVEGQWRPEMVQASQKGQTVQANEFTMAVPIRVRDHVAGVVRFRKPEGVDVWTAEEIRLMETLVEQLGVALEGARLHQDTQRRAVREQLTSEVTARIRETLDLETVLKTAVQEVRQALSLPEVVIRLVTKETGDGSNPR